MTLLVGPNDAGNTAIGPLSARRRVTLSASWRRLPLRGSQQASSLANACWIDFRFPAKAALFFEHVTAEKDGPALQLVQVAASSVVYSALPEHAYYERYGRLLLVDAHAIDSAAAPLRRCVDSERITVFFALPARGSPKRLKRPKCYHRMPSYLVGILRACRALSSQTSLGGFKQRVIEILGGIDPCDWVRVVIYGTKCEGGFLTSKAKTAMGGPATAFGHRHDSHQRARDRFARNGEFRLSNTSAQDTISELLAAADKALYAAKNSGRDRVVQSNPAPAEA